MKTLAELKKEEILARLLHFNGNRTHTAKSLGIGVRTLQRALTSYNVAKGATAPTVRATMDLTSPVAPVIDKAIPSAEGEW